MRGYYFVNSAIDNKRAHTSQMLQTAQFMGSVEVIFPKFNRDYDIKNLFSYYGLGKNVSVTFRGIFGLRDVSILSFLLFDISAAFFLLKHRRKADFIYIRSSFFFALACVACLLRIPFFYEIHRKPRSWSERVRDTILSGRARGLVVISEHLKEYYLKRNKYVLLAHDAVSLERFVLDIDKNEARKKLGIGSGAVFGMYIGSISKLKGADIIFDAAKYLPDVNFYLVGPVAGEFKERKTPVNVNLFGKIPQGDVPLWQKAADFLIIPHPDTEYSQSPMKLFEYLAAGRPIISSDLPNIREVLPLNGNVFFNSGSSDRFVLAVKKYLSDKDMYDGKARGNGEIAKDYTWEKRGKKISEFVNQVLSSK